MFKFAHLLLLLLLIALIGIGVGVYILESGDGPLGHRVIGGSTALIFLFIMPAFIILRYSENKLESLKFDGSMFNPKLQKKSEKEIKE